MEPTHAATEHAGQAGHEPHLVPYRTFFIVWGALLALTALLVAVSRLNHEALAVPALLTVTPLKAGLVFYWFMHLKYEGTALKVMVFTALATLIIFIGLLFTDISNR